MKISIVIPAYNEAERLPPTLEEIKTTFADAGWADSDWECVVVNDGSADRTWEIIEDWSARFGPARGINCEINGGKGEAVRRGVMDATGECIVIYDADAATPAAVILEYAPWILEQDYDLVGGSRELGIRAGRDVSNSPRRRLAGRIFSLLTRSVVPDYLDTQCGFKLLRRKAGQHLFSMLNQSGFVWDVELLALARKNDYKVAEVPIDWHHVPGSKISILRDGWKMFWQLQDVKKRMKK